MRTKNAAKITAAEHAYLAMVKSSACIVCEQAGPSDAHHVEQGNHFTSLPLCKDCHTGSHNGIHGRKHMWSIKKLTELSALNLFIGKVWNDFHRGNSAVRRAQ